MPEPERPPRVVPLRAASRSAALPSAADMARRLAALERQVEQALSTGAPEASGLDALGALADDALGVLAGVRRWISGEDADGPSPLLAMARDALYRWWFRVDCVGRERIPAVGPVLVVVNRSGALVPYEPFMVAAALDGTLRAARPFVDDALLALPLLGPALSAADARPARLAAVRRVLAADEAAIVQPEGPEAVAHTWPQRYRVAGFGRGALLRAAIETGAPIVPVAAIGAEEVHPTLARLELPGRFLGLPAVPLTTNVLPLPAKWTLYVGEPLDVAGRFDPATADDAGTLRALRIQVRERLQGLVSDGLRRRRGLFR
jgi:1-acyl-sn-glycerol-3-phosphate acyltransferase